MYAVVVTADDGDNVLVRPNIFPAVFLDVRVLYPALLRKSPVQRFIKLHFSDLFFNKKITFWPLDHFLDHFFFSNNVGLFLFKNDVLSVNSKAY